MICVEFRGCDEYGPWPLKFTAATWKKYSVPFVKFWNIYDVVGSTLYGVAGNQPDELVLYCKLYDVMGRPLSAGAVQLTVLTVFWFDNEEVITGASGMLDGVAVFVTCVEFAGCDEYGPWPLKFTAATWK